MHETNSFPHYEVSSCLRFTTPILISNLSVNVDEDNNEDCKDNEKVDIMLMKITLYLSWR
jgi:hypothetical protein